MKLDKINGFTERKLLTFTGRRECTNAVSQLMQNNPYSLTEPNQRNIINSIAELGKSGDEKSINFLLNTAAKSKYSTNIILKNQPKNNWKKLLLAAAAAAAALVPAIVQSKIFEKISKISNDTKLNKTEREILKLRDQLLAVVNQEQINNEAKGTEKDFEKNLDYLIVSSETTQEHKKYILKQLNYLMSDKYEINPQLADKKSIVAAELVNDMAIAVPGNNIPNIKAVNQKQHGMCAAISIVRKKLAYEDKPNYINSILSELDSSSTISVYDRNHLGSGKKIKVEKVPVDFKTAISKGYRIIDTSAMHWMYIGGMIGASNLTFEDYTPFDSENFDVKTDSFFNIKLEDPTLEKTQNYYQSLIIAKNLLENYKANSVKDKVVNSTTQTNTTLKQLGATLDEIRSLLGEIAPDLSKQQIQALTSEIIKLEKPLSNKIEKGDIYSYIPNEEDKVKKEKIANYIINKTGIENISEKDKEKLFNLFSFYSANMPKGKKDNRIRHAESLYNIAAAFRNQVINGLDDEKVLYHAMRKEGLPPREELLSNHINILINKLESKSPDTDIIIEELAPSFDSIKPTRKNMINALKDINSTLDKALTVELDKVYEALHLGSKKQTLVVYIDDSINEIKNKNSSFIKNYSEIFNNERDPEILISSLEELKEKVENGGEKEYREVFAKLRNNSQIAYIKMIFSAVEQQIPIDESTKEGKELKEMLDGIRNSINNIEGFVLTCSNVLKVRNPEGRLIYSADPKDILARKYELENEIAPEETLKELQNHFIKIAQDLSSDEFQSRQGKLKDKSLYKFSDTEKALLKDTEQRINPMLSFVRKELAGIRKELKDVLENTNQQIGLNNGRFWVVEDGGSGLSAEKQVRILEYMTGRAHKTTPNIKEALEEIKKGPYSGITGSSVFHDRIGGHAQYIADIAPVEITNSNGEKEVQEVLFQDNTWGASENENTWTDSQGLKRTDYSDHRGGSLGYITNDKYQNGNFVERILGDMVLSVEPESVESKTYRKIKGKDRDSFRMPQYYDIILEGKSPKAKSISDSIHDTLFVQTARLVEKLHDFAEKYTVKELQAMITDVKGAGKNWKDTYEALKKRVFPISGKGIETEEEYNKLADNDYLKVILEKIALKKRAPLSGLEASLAKVRTIEGLSSFEKAQKEIALKSFKYSFTKSPKIIDYLAESFGEKEEDEIDKILEKHNIVLSEDEYDKLIDKFSVDLDEFNGSAKTTFNLIMEAINKSLDNIIKYPKANKELKDFYKNFLKQKIYFNESDLDMSDLDNQKIKHVIKFIDKVFDPADNKELIKIYRRIQDLTTDEFENEILPLVSDEDLGIKQVSGYDILKAIKRGEEEANNDFINNVYYDSLVRDNGNKEYEKIYSYNKLFRTAKFTPKNTFSRFYNDIYSDLTLLTLTKLFNKYKDNNIRKYNAYPAYPKTDYLSESYLQTSFNNTIEAIDESAEVIKTIKNQIQNYNISDILEEYKNKTGADTIVKGSLFKELNNIFGELVTLNLNDETIKDVTDNAYLALEFEEGHSFNDYLPLINNIQKRLNDFRNSAPEDKLLEVIKEKIVEIDTFKEAFADVLVQPKYQNKITKIINDYTKALAKNKTKEAELLKARLYKDFSTYHIMNDPEALLSQYIKSCAKDSKINKFNTILESILKHGLDNAKLLDIQAILMEAVSEGVDLSTREQFKKHNLGFLDTTYSMDSEEMVAQMINQLIGDDNNQTALLFIEKLGLADTYVKYVAEKTDYEKLKDIVNEAFETTTNFQNFQKALSPYLTEAFDEMKKEENADMSVLDKLKDAITKYSNDFSVNKEAADLILEAVDNIKQYCIDNPDASKLLIYSNLIRSAQQNCVNFVKDLIKANDGIMNAHAAILNMVNQILLMEDSEASKYRIIANEKFEEILKYKDSLNNSLQEQK